MIFIDDYDDNSEYIVPALYRIMAAISYFNLKKECNETVKLMSWDDPAWKIVERDLKNNDTKIDFVIKSVYDKRFIDMSVSNCEEIRDIEAIFQNHNESEILRPSVNVTKTDRIKIYNARLLKFKNSFNAAFIGDPIIFEANEKTTFIKNITKTVNLKFDGMGIGHTKRVIAYYNLRRCNMIFRYLIDFEIDGDASITIKSHCSNNETRTLNLTKFLNENPEILSNLDFFDDNIKLENSNGTFILRNFPTKQTTESVIMSGYFCCIPYRESSP